MHRAADGLDGWESGPMGEGENARIGPVAPVRLEGWPRTVRSLEGLSTDGTPAPPRSKMRKPRTAKGG